MKRQNLKNKEIDQIGGELLKITQPTNDEIEKIVGNPQLFDSIQAKIKSEKKSDIETDIGFVNWSWLKVSFLNRQMAVGAAAILFVFLAFAISIIYKNQTSTQIAEEKSKFVQPEIKWAEDLPKDFGIEKDFESKEIDKKIISNAKYTKPPKRITKTNLAKPQKIIAKKVNKPKRAEKQKTVRKKSPPQIAKEEPQKVFYSLPFAENSGAEATNLQVVSARLSRSELFALGVNLQLENEDSGVETELLVGDDGVARAIRVIEKD